MKILGFNNSQTLFSFNSYFCAYLTMKHDHKSNENMSFWRVVVTIVILLTFHNINSYSQVTDSLPSDKIINRQSKSDTFSLKISKELTAPVKYKAEDSLVINIDEKTMILYGKESQLNYTDVELKAPLITFEQQTGIMSAFLTKDSAGRVISMPEFSQNGFVSKSDTIRFNMRTGRGITKGTYTQQGEMYIYGEKIKKVSDDILFAFKTRFTTCNLDTPHFAFVSREAKFVNKKMAYTGPVHPEIEGVPLPVYLPFGIYPLNMGRHSGLLSPSFTANEQMGLALEGLGYYKIINDHWDVIARTTIYSYGGWTAAAYPRYYKRYKYRGDLAIEYQRFKINFKGDPDYVANKTISLRWTHNADMKSRPGVNFMANVSAASSKFNEQIPNNPVKNFTNQLQSTISYSKSWKDKPFNLGLRVRHSQNTLLRRIDLYFPDVTFSVNTLYPFRRKDPVGAMKWYENLGIALNTAGNSNSYFYDTAGRVFNQISDNLQWGATHNVPITLSLPSLGPLQITPSVSYQERWYQRKIFRSWNDVSKKVDTSYNYGFFTARQMGFGLTAATRIFGMYTFGQSSRVSALRHEIRPSVSINYTPDMNRNSHYSYRLDTAGRVTRASVYDGTIPGAFGEGKFGGINFVIDNNISMKVKDKSDSASLKKISLIDGLSLSGRYNFLADSFKLSPLVLSARSNLFNKVSVTASGTLNPYQTDSLGQNIDKLIWNKKFFTLGRLVNADISLQSSFRGGEDKGITTPNPENLLPVDPNGYLLDEYQQEAAYIRNNPGEFADFTIPWNVDVAYSLRYSKSVYTGNRKDFSQNVNINGSLNLTPKWKIGVNAYYDITNSEIGTMSMYLSRDMHCWQMSINISPVGKYRFFTITINPKSPILRDLKVNRTRYFYE